MAKKKLSDNVDDFLAQIGAEPVSVIKTVERIPTGLLTVDHILDGGMPESRMIELFGPPGGGKSSLALSTLKGAQRKYPDSHGLYLDLEQGLSDERISDFGIDKNWLAHKKSADHGEEWLQTLEKSIESGFFKVIVLDSVAGLTPKSWMQGDIGDKHALGARAAMLAEAMERLHNKTVKAGVCVIFINQIRENFNTVGFGPAQPNTTGGKSVQFFCDVRLEVKSVGQIKIGEEKVGHFGRLTIKKNRVGQDKQQAEFEVLYSAPGVDCRKKVFELANLYKVVQRKGAWYNIDDQKLGQGEENAIEFLDDHPEWSSYVLAAVKAELDAAKEAKKEKAMKKLETEWLLDV